MHSQCQSSKPVRMLMQAAAVSQTNAKTGGCDRGPDFISEAAALETGARRRPACTRPWNWARNRDEAVGQSGISLLCGIVVNVVH